MNSSMSRNLEHNRECLLQSVSIRRELGDRSNLCFSLYILSTCLLLLDDFGEAEALVDEALTIQAEIGYASVYIGLLTYKAQFAFWRGKLDSAAQYLQTVQDFTGDRVFLYTRSMRLAILSAMASVGGDHERGYALCQQAISALPLYLNERATTLQWELALAYCGLENNTAARHSLRLALNNTADDPRPPIDRYFSPPLAAVLTARAGHSERAAELLGLAYSAPKERTGWMEKWLLLLEAKLGAEVYQAAFERGKALDLETVVTELIGELTGS
jgi:tetratricopeptide (TPR) repeat protein